MTETTSLRLADAGFAIAGQALLQPTTLTFRANAITGLIGQNGAGKSTLLKLLAHQQTPTQGAVYLEDRALPLWPEREFARRAAYLPQRTPPALGLTVRELVRFGRYPWHGALGRFGPRDAEKVDDAMAQTGVAQLADRFVDTLSGGERQRAWIAMLVAQDARWLLLDEPISALDAAHQVEVLRLLRTLCDTQGVASVVVIHEINLAARFCDEIIALKQGRVIAQSSPQTLMAPDQLAAIYDAPMGVVHPVDSGGALAYLKA